MAKSKSTPALDGTPTTAERRSAVRSLQKGGGAHLARPQNLLVSDTPRETVERCRRIIDWLAHIEEPFSGEELEAAKADVLHGVVDALKHAETVLFDCGSEAGYLQAQS